MQAKALFILKTASKKIDAELAGGLIFSTLTILDSAKRYIHDYPIIFHIYLILHSHPLKIQVVFSSQLVFGLRYADQSIGAFFTILFVIKVRLFYFLNNFILLTNKIK